MFSPLPIIEPRDSHTLWYAPSQPYRSNPATSHHPTTPGSQHTGHGHRRSGNAGGHGPRGRAASPDSLATLNLEERGLRVRKQNIASFGYSWIRPAGYPKTMKGIREEEIEREEAAAAAEQAETETDGHEEAPTGVDMTGMAALDRDLDGDIPDADEGRDDTQEDDEDGGGDDTRGLVEDGEGDLEEEDEDALMGRDLDDGIPDAFGERDLDDDVPSASSGDNDSDDSDEEDDQEADHSMMARNLDSDVPNPAEDDPAQEQEWEHTDTEEEDEEEDDDENDISMDTDDNNPRRPRQSLLRSPAPGRLAEPPPLRPQRPRQETEAERQFLARWSDGGPGALGSGEMTPETTTGLRIPRRRTRRSGQSDSSNSIG